RVIGVLLFLSNFSDNRVGNAIELNLLIDHIAIRKKLARRFISDYNNAPGFLVVLFADQASAIDLYSSNLLVDRPDPAHLKARSVERTLHAKITFHDFWSNVL